MAKTMQILIHHSDYFGSSYIYGTCIIRAMYDHPARTAHVNKEQLICIALCLESLIRSRPFENFNISVVLAEYLSGGGGGERGKKVKLKGLQVYIIKKAIANDV